VNRQRTLTASVRATAKVVVLAVAVLSTTSCGSLGPDTRAAGDVALRFTKSVADRDGTAACALLAPSTRSELESGGKPCAQAVLEEQLPTGSVIERTSAFGRGAQSVLRGDVVFLAEFGSRWLVTAAGCRPRDAAPYDCTVSGG